MSVTRYCQFLKSLNIGVNNSGVNYDPTLITDEIIIKDKYIVDLCLTCTFDECEAKLKDDNKKRRKHDKARVS